jgi:D-alanyl-D-alanine carboxypeptidase/D-alanyl-D-alanine-endopeptidase (penicillin-binding protein 4)
VLVGGGDPFLASDARKGRASYPDRADVTTLAQAAAHKLRSLRVRRVTLAYDDSYFTGPSVNPTWPDSYLFDVVPRIGALWVDEGRSATGYGFAGDPAARAAQVFGDAVRAAGIKVGPKVVAARAPGTARDVATVSSAPLGEIVERTLAVSDNAAAEVLARHVGLAEKQQGSFSAGTAAVLDVVRRLGVTTSGDRLYDGSGLSRSDRLRPETLAAVLRLAAGRQHPELRQVLTGLPVAGFTGSLQYRFAKGPAEARGRVRAKTGTLTGVHGLAGLADDATGARMVFVIVADRVGPLKNLEAQTLIDRIAGALGACRCGVGSAS